MKKRSLILLISILVIGVGIAATVIILNRPDEYETLMKMDMGTQDNTKNQNLAQETLTFYFTGKEFAATREVLDEVEKQAKDSLNIKLNFKFTSDNKEKTSIEQVETFIKSGIPVDAFYFSSDSSSSLKALVNDNIIMDLTELSEKYAPKYFKGLSDEDKKLVSLNNRIYAIPNQMPMSNQALVLVNEKLMSEFNIPSINSISDLELYLKKAKEINKDIAPLRLISSSLEVFAGGNGYAILDDNYQGRISQGLVYKWNDPDMKLMAWEQTPEFKNSLDKLNNWYKQGYIAHNNYSITSQDLSDFSSGKWPALIFYGTPDSEQLNNCDLDDNVDFKYKSYLLYPDKLYPRKSPLEGSMVVNKSSQHADRVLMFYEWLNSSRENYDTLMYGIKGKAYNLSNENVIPADKNAFKQMLSWPWKVPFRNILLERPLKKSTYQDLQEFSQKIERKSKYAPHLGFSPDYSKLAEIVSYRESTYLFMENKITSGTFKESDITDFIKESKNMGADKMVAEVQKQLNIWKKNN